MPVPTGRAETSSEDFLLPSGQTLVHPDRPIWPSVPLEQGVASSSSSSNVMPAHSSTPINGFVPKSVGAKQRRVSRTKRIEEPVASGSRWEASASARGNSPKSSAIEVFDLSPESFRVGDQSRSDFYDIHRRIPSSEESDEWVRRRKIAEKNGHAGSSRSPEIEAKRRRLSEGSLKGKEVLKSDDLNTKVANSPVVEEDDDEGGEWCAICLQSIRDATIVGACGHKGFCFECINVWANQSRKCPLCTAPLNAFLLHKLDDPAGPKKFYLPPLPSVKPSSHITTTLAASLPTRPLVRPFRQTGPDILVGDRTQRPVNGDVWAQVQRNRREQTMDEEDALERAIDRRVEIYRHGLFAKFADNPDMIARATSFVRRELRVWRNVDVEFLTTYIISLMRSIDIRSEPAVRLLADFLDGPGVIGRDRKGAEHFAHELYSFLRSPYRDLAVYDAIAQYDPVPQEAMLGANGHAVEDRVIDVDSAIQGNARSERAPSISIQDRDNLSRSSSRLSDEDSYSDYSDESDPGPSNRSPVHRRSEPRERERSESISPRLPRRSIPARRTSPPNLTQDRPRRWNETDTYVPANRQPEAGTGVTRRQNDSWIAPDLRESKIRRRNQREERKERLPQAVEDPSSPVHRGLRAWDDAEDKLAGGLSPRNDDVVRRNTPPTEEHPVQNILEGDTNLPAPDGPASRKISIRGLGGFSVTDSQTSEEDRDRLHVGEIPKSPAASSAREAILARLLAKLLREKMASKQDKPNQQTPEKEANQTSSTVASPTTTASELKPEGGDVDSLGSAAEAEAEAKAKARARLQLKLKLARERQHQLQSIETASSTGSGPQDRAAELKARLMAMKRQKAESAAA